MRLWTLHPGYLDAQGLVSAWREGLLARQVLRGKTRGYRNHPQLNRFREHASPLSAINAYLAGIHAEATRRGYKFDRSKLGVVRNRARIRSTDGQLDYEWRHLRKKLRERSRELYRRQKRPAKLRAHPLFRVGKGAVQDWERVRR